MLRASTSEAAQLLDGLDSLILKLEAGVTLTAAEMVELRAVADGPV